MDSHNGSDPSGSTPLAVTLQPAPLPVPHLSSSCSSSTNSSLLPTPEGDILTFTPPFSLAGAKKHAGDGSSPYTRSISPHAASEILSNPFPPSRSRGSPPSPRRSQWTSHVRTRTLAAQQAMARRMHPYNPRSTATPLELRFTTWALGHPSHIPLTLDDVDKGKKHFQAALSAMPDNIIRKAYQARLAAQESIANRLRLTLSELETVERLRDFLNAIKDEQNTRLAVSAAQLEDVTGVMEGRGLTHVEDEGEFHRAAYADDLIALSISNAQLNQVRECMLARPGFHSANGVGSGAVDHGDQELDGEESKGHEEEEPLDDMFPELLSSDPSELG